MLKSVLKDSKQVRKELEKLDKYLDTSRLSEITNPSSLVARVKEIIEAPQDFS